MDLEIKLNRSSKIYFEGETLEGVVIVNCPAGKHEGLYISLDGNVNLTLSTKNVGMFEAFYNSVKPIQLMKSQFELMPPGKLQHGVTQVPFEFQLKSLLKEKLFETYHGVFVNIIYMLKAELRRNFLAKTLQKTQQFIVQYRPVKRDPELGEKPVNFSISPETLQKTTKEKITIPRFLITGNLDSTECCITKPFTGNLTIHHTEVSIKSIELQLVRIETCGCAEGYSRDATEIETIQLVDGNCSTKLQIPIYMVFPRLFTCPTLVTKNFKIEFEVNLVVLFQDDHLVTENFQIILHRNH